MRVAPGMHKHHFLLHRGRKDTLSFGIQVKPIKKIPETKFLATALTRDTIDSTLNTWSVLKYSCLASW